MATPVSGTDGGEGSSAQRPDVSLVPLPRQLTNWGNVVETLNLYVAGNNFPEMMVKVGGTEEEEMRYCFNLDDLWESLVMISVYGAGVPYTMDGNSMIQYYNPSLSGIQIYVNSSDTQTWVRASEMQSAAVTELDTPPLQNLVPTETESSRTVLTTDFAYSAVSSSPTVEGGEGTKFLEYFERELPFNRPTLIDQLAVLGTKYPALKKLTSIDLHPSSWIAVAWYPSYEIPSGLSLKKTETAFLTFHFLSTRVKCNPPLEVQPAPDKWDRNFNRFLVPSGSLKLTLPKFGVATYKIRGSNMAPTEPHEIEQETSLHLAAENWLKRLNVCLPDFQFFQQSYRRGG